MVTAVYNENHRIVRSNTPPVVPLPQPVPPPEPVVPGPPPPPPKVKTEPYEGPFVDQSGRLHAQRPEESLINLATPAKNKKIFSSDLNASFSTFAVARVELSRENPALAEGKIFNQPGEGAV